MEKTILCFGDSNTFGYVPGGEGARYDRNTRWTGQLQKKLGAGYYVIEEGLNSRTTIFDDPVAGDKNGIKHIGPCLASHKPLDLVIVMLGSNDTKDHLNVNAWSIARGMGQILDAIQRSQSGRNGQAPNILLMSPAPIREECVTNHQIRFWEMSEKSLMKSKQLATFYEPLAKQYGAEFLDAGNYCKPSLIDCLHLDAEAHTALADAVYHKVLEIL